MNTMLTITSGPEERPIHLKLHKVDEDGEMEISIERISTNSYWIDREIASSIIEHLKNQFEL